MKVGTKAADKDPAITFMAKVGTSNAIKKASKASPVPNHAATVSSLANPPSCAKMVNVPTMVAADRIFCLIDLTRFSKKQNFQMSAGPPAKK